MNKWSLNINMNKFLSNFYSLFPERKATPLMVVFEIIRHLCCCSLLFFQFWHVSSLQLIVCIKITLEAIHQNIFWLLFICKVPFGDFAVIWAPNSVLRFLDPSFQVSIGKFVIFKTQQTFTFVWIISYFLKQLVSNELNMSCCIIGCPNEGAAASKETTYHLFPHPVKGGFFLFSPSIFCCFLSKFPVQLYINLF